MISLMPARGQSRLEGGRMKAQGEQEAPVQLAAKVRGAPRPPPGLPPTSPTAGRRKRPVVEDAARPAAEYAVLRVASSEQRQQDGWRK